VHASKDPWIAREVAFLRAAHDAGVPVLGICFGAQALAAALGGAVARAPGREIGWVHVDGPPPFGGRWFSWHEDAFKAPPGATVLGANRQGTQAFTLGHSVGVQFHPEVDEAIVADWLRTGRDAVPDPAPMRRETSSRIKDARKRAFALFDAFAPPG
jgi:GMP synthase-like glutamine amidotransferase